MATRSGFAIEQHRAAGRQVQNIRKRLFDLSSDLSRYYRTKGRCYQAALSVIQAVDSLRSQLDRQVRREHHDDPEADHVYYRQPIEGKR